MWPNIVPKICQHSLEVRQKLLLEMIDTVFRHADPSPVWILFHCDIIYCNTKSDRPPVSTGSFN